MAVVRQSRISTFQTPLGSVVGETPEIQKIYQIVLIAARTTYPVLIVGEAGTGKEVIARTIHSTGPLRHMPFVSLDCASLQAEALERELLGGAKSASVYRNQGTSAIQAHNGTVFLDRIGDLDLDAQATLLRAIHDREIRSPHDTLRAGTRLRVLAASVRDLQFAVAEGTFRQDLYFRLNVLSLRVPPLRERRRDVPSLVSSFLRQFSESTGREYRMSDEALRAILIYDWPGNVRELEACMERACCSAIGPVISLLDLPDSINRARERTDTSLPHVRVVPLDELEKRSILETMLQVKGDKRVAAKLLGIGRTTLYRKLREYDLEEQDSK